MNHPAKEIKMKDPILTELARLAKAWGDKYQAEYRARRKALKAQQVSTSDAVTKELPTC